MRRWGFLTAIALAFAPSAANAEVASDARVATALRAGDSAGAAAALIEAVDRAIAGGGLALSREGLRPALARELDFFAAREVRAEPPQFLFTQASRTELQGGIQSACAASADLAGARVTASRFQTTAAAGAAIASCAFESQQEDDYRWVGVVIRTQGDGGLRMRASFATQDAEVRRAASQHLSVILASLANAVQGAQAPMRPRPTQRRAPRPPPGTTI